MNEIVNATIAALAQWSQWLSANIPQPQPFNQLYGWNTPSVTKDDLIKRIFDTQGLLSSLPDTITDPDLSAALIVSPGRLQWITANVLPNIAGANAIHVVPQIFDELDRIERAIGAKPLPDWERLANDELELSWKMGDEAIRRRGLIGRR